MVGMLSPSLPGQERAKATPASRRSRAKKLKAAAPLQLGDSFALMKSVATHAHTSAHTHTHARPARSLAPSSAFFWQARELPQRKVRGEGRV